MTIRVSCAQIYPRLGDKEYNIQKMEQYIHQTMTEYPDTQLIVFPELATSGYEGTVEQFQALAETTEDGESIRRMGALAAKYGIYIVYGFPERDLIHTDVLYNSAVLIDKDGKPMGTYRKVHPFASEKTWCRAGCDFPVFDTDLGRLGIMICWDTAFPEVARIYGLKGADLLIVSTNWEDPYEEEWDPTKINSHEEDWDLITRARAYDNTLHLVAANRVGDDGKVLSFFGRSKIIGPTGREIAALDTREEGILSAEIDLSLTEKKRVQYYTFFKDRVPDAYDEVVKKY